MFPGDHLDKGEQVESANGNFVLVLQKEGFLAILDKEGKPVWKVGGGRGQKLMFEKNGNLVFYDVKGMAMWQSNTKGLGVEALVLKDDGNLVLITKNGDVKWQTGTAQSNKFFYVLS